MDKAEEQEVVVLPIGDFYVSKIKHARSKLMNQRRKKACLCFPRLDLFASKIKHARFKWRKKEKCKK